MKIISSIADDVWHNLGDASYEWWYFDAIANDGYSLVITLFYGLPFSPYYNSKIAAAQTGVGQAPAGQHCAVYFCLYKQDRGTAVYALNEYSQRHFHASSQTPQVKLNNSSLNYTSEGGFTLTIDEPALWKRHIHAELSFQPLFQPQFNNLPGQASDNSTHLWNCVAPRCQVSGDIEITGIFKQQKIHFQGLGYHDHNYGSRPMHHDMNRWHWGRLHTTNFTSIYYLIEDQAKPQNLLAVFNEQGEASYIGSAQLQTKESRHLMGVPYANSLELASDNINLLMNTTGHNGGIVDQGPFYLRFLAAQSLQIGGKTEVGQGFAEAFEPAKLFVKAYWPFIKMKIRKTL